MIFRFFLVIGLISSLYAQGQTPDFERFFPDAIVNKVNMNGEPVSYVQNDPDCQVLGKCDCNWITTAAPLNSWITFSFPDLGFYVTENNKLKALVRPSGPNSILVWVQLLEAGDLRSESKPFVVTGETLVTLNFKGELLKDPFGAGIEIKITGMHDPLTGSTLQVGAVELNSVLPP